MVETTKTKALDMANKMLVDVAEKKVPNNHFLLYNDMADTMKKGLLFKQIS